MAGSNLFTGTLDLLILHTLLPGPMHGYAIGRHLKDRSAGSLDLEEGVLYPALYRLNRKGLIKGEWGETETGRRARFYSLRKKGEKALKKERARWEEHLRAVQAVLDPHQTPGSSAPAPESA
ncbi:MAG: PadR family transcriptional regulator [Gemmatimonadota bacterium]|jgi:transcriptional regulator